MGKGILQVPPLRCAPVGMTKWRVAAHLCGGGGGWTNQHNNNQPGFQSLRYGVNPLLIQWFTPHRSDQV